MQGGGGRGNKGERVPFGERCRWTMRPSEGMCFPFFEVQGSLLLGGEKATSRNICGSFKKERENGGRTGT